ncbi:MAG TPA: AAA family ATPase [Planctomycetota bacterium]|nr:AAA family ATPase [Planctomycetota bacterium]
MRPRKEKEEVDPPFPGYIREIRLKRTGIPGFENYPYSLPVVRTLGTLRLHPKVTFFVGENGSGKSTLLEAVANAVGMNAEGGGKNFFFATRRSDSDLGEHLIVVRGAEREKDCFFLRAESFYNVATEIEKLNLYLGDYGDRSLHEQSHGESFLALFTHRFFGRGFYVLDEPEAALSPQRQMAFLAALHAHVTDRKSQFVIATHSPIILAYPHATIYEFSSEGIRETKYEDTEQYRTTRSFLEDRDRFLRHLLAPLKDDPPQ